MGAFKAWIRGSNTYFDTNTDSEVQTAGADSAPTLIASPSVPNGWLEIDVWGFDPADEDEGEAYQTPSHATFDDPRIRRTYKLQLLPLNRTTDASTIASLESHLRKRYLYLAVSSYDETLHTAGYVLAVRRTFQKESLYESNEKVYTLELQNRNLTV